MNITNTATATFIDPFGVPGTVTSNPSVIRVDEVLDVTVVANDAGNVAVVSPSADNVLSFTVTNTGNGSETYRLSVDAAVAGDDFDPANVRVYLDNGDNVFDPATDILLVPGSNDPVLAADASRRVFVVADVAAGLANGELGRIRLRAEALTALATPGPDAPGTTFAGQGTNGGNAVVGASGAEAGAEATLAISLVAATFAKTATVLDPYGGSNAIPGALITYTLTLGVTGTGDLAATQIVDPIPAGTTYAPGTLRLDGTLLTDVADGDAGRFTGSAITVDLGTVTAPASHTVTFGVTINTL